MTQFSSTSTDINTFDLEGVRTPLESGIQTDRYLIMSSVPYAILYFTGLGIPSGAEITSAQITLTATSTTVGSDFISVLDDADPGPIQDGDHQIPVVGEESRTGVMTGFEPTPIDLTDGLAEIVQRPEWSETSALKILHRRQGGSSRRVCAHTYSDPEYRPLLEVEYIAPTPPGLSDEEYRIVGPAGLETVRLVGVAEGGALVPVRLRTIT